MNSHSRSAQATHPRLSDAEVAILRQGGWFAGLDASPQSALMRNSRVSRQRVNADIKAIERQTGKILVMGGASALRGMNRASIYSAARGAQLAYVQAVRVEVAGHKV